MDFTGEILRDREWAGPAGGMERANVGELVSSGVAEDEVGGGGCSRHSGWGLFLYKWESISGSQGGFFEGDVKWQ